HRGHSSELTEDATGDNNFCAIWYKERNLLGKCRSQHYSGAEHKTTGAAYVVHSQTRDGGDNERYGHATLIARCTVGNKPCNGWGQHVAYDVACCWSCQGTKSCAAARQNWQR